MANVQRIKPFHWESSDNPDKPGYSRIHVWGLDQENNPNLVKIEDYAIPFHILVEKDPKKPSLITPEKMRLLQEKIIEKIKEKGWNDKCGAKFAPFNKDDCKKMKPLYHVGLTEESEDGVELLRRGIVKEDDVLLIKSSHNSAGEMIEKVLRYPLWIKPESGWCTFKCTWVNDKFDCVNKFLATKKLRHCEWIEFPAEQTDEKKISSLEHEYLVNARTLDKVDSELCKTWSTNPGIFSFDFECDTPNKRKFPDLWNPECPITMVSCGYNRDDGSEKRSYTIVVGDCPPSKKEGFEVIVVDDEIELLDKMCELIAFHDPDYITGFNIQAFDFEYADARYLQKGIHVWPVCGRLLDINSTVKTIKWSSKARSEVKVSHFLCPGRIVLDVHLEAKSNNRFPQYNLNYVANHFLGVGKVPVTPYEMFCAFEIHRIGLKAGKGTPEYELAMEEIAKVLDYCEEDADLCLRLFKEMKMNLNGSETANVMCVNMYDLNTRGQQYRCISQLFEAAWNCKCYLNKMPVTKIPFEGGKVGDPDPGIHDVMVIDFQSLYPSIIMDRNISYDTYIPMKLRHLPGMREMCNIKQVECTEEKDPNAGDDDESIRIISREDKGVKEFWFIKKQYLEGIVPRLVRSLCTQRKAVQALMRTETDDNLAAMYDKKQNALKVSTNSFFGFMGVLEGGKRPFREGAVATTSWGREYITKTNDYLIKTYNAKIVYGDTDSSMVSMPDQVKSRAEMDYWIKRICKEVTDLFDEDIVMKPEYCGQMLCIKRKKYIIKIFEADGTFKMKNGIIQKSVRGTIGVKRDSCDWARVTYDVLTEMIMDFKPCYDVMMYLSDRLEMMMNGEVSHTDLLVSKSLSAHFNSPNAEMKLFSENMINNYGKIIEAGERINFVVVKNSKRYKGEKMMMEDVYLQSQETDKPMQLDYVYYIEKTLQTHADDVMFIAYRDELTKAQFKIKHQKPGDKNFIRCITPVGLACDMIKNRKSVDDFRELVQEHKYLLCASVA